MMPPIGGREDYAALFHEAGHAEHYGSTHAELAFEFRHLGDNSVTESFAFLLEGLTANAEWLARVIGEEEAEARSSTPVRRGWSCCAATRRRSPTRSSCTAPETDLAEMPERYASLLGERIGVPWPRETWLSDVDSSFYVACYLRAWALEVDWRDALGGAIR